MGGEEFSLLLPETDLSGAILVAERLRGAVEKLEMEISRKKVRFTISVGVAESHGDISPEELMKNADNALYDAKNSGRNRISHKV